MNVPETVHAWLELRASESAGSSWLFFEGDSYTLADVVERADRFAVGLAERGVGKGDRVALISRNVPETLFAWLGASMLGAIFVPLNPALKPSEIDALVALTTPRAVLRDDMGELARAGRGAPRADVSGDDIAVLIATSGTTGAPKAVAQTHRTYALTAEAFPAWIGLDSRDRLLATLPLFHINAQAYSVMGALGANASLAIAPKFSATQFFSNAKRLGATQFNAVGAMLHILLKTEPSNADRDHALRLCYAALALAEDQHVAFEARFGVEMTIGYGMSETTFGTVWPRGEARRYGSMGALRQHPRLGEINRARVVRDDGAEAEANETGELWLSNPATMKEYWNAPAETAAALVDGWMHTGDLVKRDADGFFTFVARKKDVIRRRGENISAAEIENALTSHPSVREAAAIGVPSDLGEDDVVAYVVLSDAIDGESLREWVRERLADFKVPSVIHVRDELPKTATQRIAKHMLK